MVSTDAVMPEWLRWRAAALPDGPALVAGGAQWSFRDLDAEATRTARRLAALGMGTGTRVALALRNGAPFVILVHALARLGAIAVPLNVRLAPPELRWQLADSRASAVISDAAPAEAAAGTGGGPDGVRHIAADGLDGAPEADVPAREHIALSDVQGLVYTSATSGRPKGVLLTYGNHWWSAVGSALNLGVHREDRWLAPLPLYHVGGLAIIWRSVLYGIPLVLHEAFDPAAVNREIDRGVTIVSLVPTMLARVLDVRGEAPIPRTLRCVLLGGAAASPELLHTCRARGIPAAPTYGLTETASQIATLAPDEVERRPGSVGRPLLPAEIRIETEERPHGEGDRHPVGEILVRGPQVMLGYADRPAESAHALRGGWLHTGDLGYLDADGYLYVIDRCDDLIVSGGENVYPAEVEAVLAGHPDVRDAAVVGLPDAEWGHAVVAVVCVRPGSTVDEETVRAFCAGRLARYKTPRRVLVARTLPRGPSGKLNRHALRAWVESGEGAAGPIEAGPGRTPSESGEPWNTSSA